jgi:hypothetical protein
VIAEVHTDEAGDLSADAILEIDGVLRAIPLVVGPAGANGVAA